MVYKTLRCKALLGLGNAYALYSKLKVRATVLTENEDIFKKIVKGE